MTATEVFELTTKGGASDLAMAVAACESLGPYCLIGGLAVNCYVEPVYTLDADIVVVAESLAELCRQLAGEGFAIETHSVNAKKATGDLRIQFTTDRRYQTFLARAQEREVLGLRVRVAKLEDVVRGKLWAYDDAQLRLSKRKKDELDLIRLAEKFPDLREMYPPELLGQLGESGSGAV